MEFLGYIAALITIVGATVGVWKRITRPKILKEAATGSASLDIEVRGHIAVTGRIQESAKGRSPLVKAKNPTYLGGLEWKTGKMLFVNRGQNPANLNVALAIPVREDEPSRRFRIEPLSDCLMEFADRIKPYFWGSPPHIEFPIRIEPGGSVQGHIEFAIKGSEVTSMLEMSPETFKVLLLEPTRYLEIEDLITGNTAEYKI